jgi:ankyrin repeat protein
MMDVETLFAAVAARDASQVRALVEAAPQLARAANDDRLPAIVFAKHAGGEEVLCIVVAAGPPLDVFEAAMVDDTDALRRALEREPASVSAYSEDGFTALHFAAFYGAPASARMLLASGASPAAVTTNFLANMPLHAAAAGGYADVMRLLLEHGADPNARQHGGFTALHTAGFRDDRAMAELLLAHGADASARSDEGQTPADTARSQGNTVTAAFLRAAATR